MCTAYAPRDPVCLASPCPQNSGEVRALAADLFTRSLPRPELPLLCNLSCGLATVETKTLAFLASFQVHWLARKPSSTQTLPPRTASDSPRQVRSPSLLRLNRRMERFSRGPHKIGRLSCPLPPSTACSRLRRRLAPFVGSFVRSLRLRHLDSIRSW